MWWAGAILFLAMSEDLIANLANAFKPLSLPTDSPLYVDLRS
jgi:hypothetical protein